MVSGAAWCGRLPVTQEPKGQTGSIPVGTANGLACTKLGDTPLQGACGGLDFHPVHKCEIGVDTYTGLLQSSVDRWLLSSRSKVSKH